MCKIKKEKLNEVTNSRLRLWREFRKKRKKKLRQTKIQIETSKIKTKCDQRRDASSPVCFQFPEEFADPQKNHV